MAGSPLNPNPNSNKPSANCEVCGLQPWKYRCPRCLILSCSLPCVNSHKQRTACTGKRDTLTDRVVPLSQFDDDLLISDYNLLEEAKRITESSRRMREEICIDSDPVVPRRFQSLHRVVKRRKFGLLYMPNGMSKRKKNKSWYSERDKSIFWTIEWRFPSTGVFLIDHNVGESVNLSTVIEKHLTPSPWNNKLRPYSDVQLDELKFFLQKNPKGLKFRELDIRAPMAQQLRNTVIIEYPVIHVFLPSDNYDFEIEKVERPSPKSEEREVSPSPKGTCSKEEEFEEGEILPDHLSSTQQKQEDALIMERAGNSEARMFKASV